MTATDVQPTVSGRLLPLPGHYDLHGDRCVVALTVRPLGLPLLHSRLTVTDGTLVIGEDEHTCELELRSRRKRRLTFTADRLLFGPDIPRRTVVLSGTVTRRGQADRALRLTGVLHHCDHERLVLWVHGKLDRVHVEAAAEFVR